MPVIELTTLLKAPCPICFDLARSIDLHAQSMADTNEQAIAGITSGLIKLHEAVTWQATHFGIRQRLTSSITMFTSPSHFRDEMTRGAFKKMTHDHYFENHAGVTIMRDRFEFESPFGFLGQLVSKVNLPILKL